MGSRKKDEEGDVLPEPLCFFSGWWYNIFICHFILARSCFFFPQQNRVPSGLYFLFSCRNVTMVDVPGLNVVMEEVSPLRGKRW